MLHFGILTWLQCTKYTLPILTTRDKSIFHFITRYSYKVFSESTGIQTDKDIASFYPNGSCNFRLKTIHSENNVACLLRCTPDDSSSLFCDPMSNKRLRGFCCLFHCFATWLYYRFLFTKGYDGTSYMISCSFYGDELPEPYPWN